MGRCRPHLVGIALLSSIGKSDGKVSSSSGWDGASIALLSSIGKSGGKVSSSSGLVGDDKGIAVAGVSSHFVGDDGIGNTLCLWG